jgi:hypothetical protein
MRNTFMFCFLFLIAVFSINSCTKEKAIAPPDFVCEDSLTFVDDILPIFQTNCAVGSCHVSGSIFAPFDATDYDTLDFFINSGALLKAIKHTGALNMPRVDPADPINTGSIKLADTTIAKIECWINSGFPKL